MLVLAFYNRFNLFFKPLETLKNQLAYEYASTQDHEVYYQS